MTPAESPVRAPPDPLREAEAALRRMGFSRVPPVRGDAPVEPEFWVQESGVPRRRYPVYLGSPTVGAGRSDRSREGAPNLRRAIVVVTSDQAAERAWQNARADPAGLFESEVAILVVSPRNGPEASAHWHSGRLDRRDLLRLATGVVVGMFRRAEAGEGGGPIDFGELLAILRHRFGVDVAGSLNVVGDEDALFILYQLAQRFSWAPGDGGSNLHSLVLKPVGPAARLPWFAA